MGFSFEPEDVDGDTGFIGWGAVLSTVIAVLALIGAVRCGGCFPALRSPSLRLVLTECRSPAP